MRNALLTVLTLVTVACSGSVGHEPTREEVFANAPIDCQAWEYNRETDSYSCFDLTETEQAKSDRCEQESIQLHGTEAATSSGDDGYAFWKTFEACFQK